MAHLNNIVDLLLLAEEGTFSAIFNASTEIYVIGVVFYFNRVQ